MTRRLNVVPVILGTAGERLTIWVLPLPAKVGENNRATVASAATMLWRQ
jgi:hypothetical protein